MSHCSALTLFGCQAPTKAAISLPSTSGQRKENVTKRSLLETKTRRDHFANTIKGRTDSALFITNKIRAGNVK